MTNNESKQKYKNRLTSNPGPNAMKFDVGLSRFWSLCERSIIRVRENSGILFCCEITRKAKCFNPKKNRKND